MHYANHLSRISETLVVALDMFYLNPVGRGPRHEALRWPLNARAKVMVQDLGLFSRTPMEDEMSSGTIYMLALSSEISAAPKRGRTIRFGRDRPNVDVCVGEDDIRVSREHGTVAFCDARWWIRNSGKGPIRLGNMRYLFPEDEPLPLPGGYTPVFVSGSSRRQSLRERREHLIEMYVGTRPPARPADLTPDDDPWRLKRDDRLALIALGQRYLYHDFHPQPLAYKQAAEQLAELYPEAGWTKDAVRRRVENVRITLSKAGVPGLTEDEVGPPVGNTLNENLIKELMLSATLAPRDLALLDE